VFPERFITNQLVGHVGFSDITTHQGSWQVAFGVDPDTKLPLKILCDFKKKVFCVKLYQRVKFLHTRPSYVLPTNVGQVRIVCTPHTIEET
jgi:hypothetical protein